MKILIVGNHTCGNRGDAAILRGLLAELRAQEPNITIDAYSRYPISSSYILGEKLTMDPLDSYHDSMNSKKDKFIKKFSRRFLAYYLAFKFKKGDSTKLPRHVLKQIEHIQTYDAVIQVGGSNFVDLYGPHQFEHALSVLHAKKKLFMIGHSVGPFNSKNYARLASLVFSKVEDLALREQLSLEFMNKADVCSDAVTVGADTAWIVPNETVELSAHLLELFNDKPVIAITLRELAPFDKRLGISQAEYEKQIADLVDNLIEKGYRVVFVSTGTGIDSYWRDDRMIALKVKELVKHDDCHVIMDELNDVQIGSFLHHCTLTIGTRLHSAIISMNFGTPAIAINYEHKSQGIMAQLDMEELSKELKSLFNGELLKTALHVLDNLDDIKLKMDAQVEKERQKCRDMVSRVIESIEQG